jgi:hypothetical protein
MPDEKQLECLRKRISNLEGIALRTRAVEKKILEGAEQRLEVINKELAGLQPRVMTSDDFVRRYQELVLERGRVQMVIAQAEKILKC